MSQTPFIDEIIPAGKPWSGIVEQGQYLSIIDLEGQQGVDFLRGKTGTDLFNRSSIYRSAPVS